MNNKQLNKLANKIYNLEVQYQDDNLTEEEKKQIEKEINNIANQIFCLPNGFEVMGQIDEIIQKKFS